MDDLTRMANMAEILGAAVVIGGLVFAIMQMRNIRQQRREMAAIELFRFFGNPDFNRAYECILQLPDGLSAKEIESRGPSMGRNAMLICTTMENIGVMTHQRIVPYAIVDNLIGASTVILWRKLEPWIESIRADVGTRSSFEWFQWLAEKLDELAQDNETPAYIKYKDWRPTRLKENI
jgi:hypothetical protein